MFTISSNFRRDVTFIEKMLMFSIHDFFKYDINRFSYFSKKAPHACLHVGFYIHNLILFHTYGHQHHQGLG